MNSKDLMSIFPHCSGAIANSLINFRAKNDYSINTNVRWAHFLAQIGYESMGLRVLEENLNYRTTALTSMYGSRITVEQAYKYGRNDSAGQVANQEAIGNIIYGGEFGRKNLGNTEPGDGFKFKGRGLIQLTGRYNYTQYANFKKMSVDQVVQYLKTPEGAVDSAGWFWYSRNLNFYADLNDINRITRIINGGHNGLDKRVELFNNIKRALKI